MKVTASLLLLASTVMAIPEPKNARAFSLFSLVTFANDECIPIAPMMIGLCITAEDCADQGGTASGNCAAAFGVCCFTIITTAPATITNNVTYIQNEVPVTATSRSFTVQGGANICQVRFDFEAATVFEGPTGGVCNVDTITVTDQTRLIGQFQNLCGTLTGQHIYVESDRASPAVILNINTGATVLSRSWKILVRTIECDSPAMAPRDCLQYFTGTSGNFQSFNYDGTTGELIDNLLYNVCIRKEAGMCSYTVRQARSATGATPDAFQVGTEVDGAVGAAECITGAFLVIPNSGVQAPEYCGSVLTNTNDDTSASPVTGNGAQFQIRVMTTTVNTGAGGSGFDLIYSQQDC